MMRIAASLVLLLALTRPAGALRLLPWTPEPVTVAPWFCHGIDCPQYTVVNSTADWEEREYEPSTWVTTEVQSILLAKATTQGFVVLGINPEPRVLSQRLFDYISGANEAGKKIAMTAPVLTAVLPGEGPFCTSNFTIGFFVPSSEEEPPAPTSPVVSMKDIGSHTYYVSQFGGYAVDPIPTMKAQQLVQQLKAAGKPIKEGMFFVAGYDPPYRLTKRHNEIWIMKAEEERKDVR